MGPEPSWSPWARFHVGQRGGAGRSTAALVRGLDSGVAPLAPYLYRGFFGTGGQGPPGDRPS